MVGLGTLGEVEEVRRFGARKGRVAKTRVFVFFNDLLWAGVVCAMSSGGNLFCAGEDILPLLRPSATGGKAAGVVSIPMSQAVPLWVRFDHCDVFA